MRSEEYFDVEVEFMNRKDKTVSWHGEKDPGYPFKMSSA